jgi:hypothetical protein
LPYLIEAASSYDEVPATKGQHVTNHQLKSSGLTKPLFLRAAIGVTAVASAVGLIAAPASAAVNHCDGDSTVVTCLLIDQNQDGTYYVEVGIDVHMSVQDAQAIIDQPGDPFTVTIVGSDPLADNNLFAVSMFGLGASAESGLSAGFARTGVPRAWLDEDDSIFDRTDEVFARIVLTDARTNTSRTFNTVIISQQF